MARFRKGQQPETAGTNSLHPQVLLVLSAEAIFLTIPAFKKKKEVEKKKRIRE